MSYIHNADGTPVTVSMSQADFDAPMQSRADLAARLAFLEGIEATARDENERRIAAERRLAEAERQCDTMREALCLLLPGLVLDLRYADQDDDKDAMRSRIRTVVDALKAAEVPDSATPPETVSAAEGEQ